MTATADALEAGKELGSHCLAALQEAWGVPILPRTDRTRCLEVEVVEGVVARGAGVGG